MISGKALELVDQLLSRLGGEFGDVHKKVSGAMPRASRFSGAMTLQTDAGTITVVREGLGIIVGGRLSKTLSK